MNKFNIWQYLGAKVDRGQLVLGLGVDGGSLRDQEPSNLMVTLLAGQVQEAALCIHLGLVVKQRLGNVDLVLLGRSVKGRCAEESAAPVRRGKYYTVLY